MKEADFEGIFTKKGDKKEATKYNWNSIIVVSVAFFPGDDESRKFHGRITKEKALTVL